MDFNTYEKTGHAEYAALADLVADILSAAIDQQGDVRLQHIQRRAKAPSSLRRKLERQGALDSAEIEGSAKDLAGVRVILYTNADVERFLGSRLMHYNFGVDWDRTKIHHPPRDPQEGAELFISNNYVVKLKDERTALPEYALFSGMWCEVQVQTTLNHAWSEMAHETIYKKPKLSGFGGDLMRAIEERMKSIMQKHLAPAGYEFQKVLIDAERLASGKALFDEGPLEALGACANNNERHDVLERFISYVLPHYDDYGSVSADILSAIGRAVKQARTTDVVPIDTPFGSLPGHTPADVARQGAQVIEYLRYADVTLTLGAIADLHASARDPEEKDLWLKAAEALAKHDLKAWEQVGPRVQSALVDWLRAHSTEELAAIRPVALTVLREVLRADISGSSVADYRTITLQQGAVAASEELRQTRGAALALLMNLFNTASDDAQRREVVHAFSIASAMPGVSQTSAELAVDILANARQIVDFYTAQAESLSFELRQALEHDLYWLRRHNQRTGAKGADPPALAAARAALLEAVLGFRDKVNADSEFAIYKTLVGFESVFPPAWDDAEIDHADDTYRSAAIEGLVAEVTVENAEAWLDRIRRCAATVSNDMATFPPFYRFLEALGKSKPEVMAGFLELADDHLARFLTSILSGLVGTEAWPRAEGTLTEWVRQRRHLSEIAWALRNVTGLRSSLLQEILDTAVASDDDEAVWSVLAAASARYEAVQEETTKRISLAALRHLTRKGDLRWVNAFAQVPRPQKSPLLLGLNESEAHELLSFLVPYPRIEYRVEDLIAALARTWPGAVIEFFGHRLRHERTEPRSRYDPVPYHFHSVDTVLAGHVELILEAARGWFEEDRGLFEYRGARLIKDVYPGFSDRLEALLLERVAGGNRDEIAFVLRIMRAYDGEIFLHRICKEIVAVLPAGDELLNLVRIVLDAMGVTTGEFGRVEGFQRKKEDVEPWLADDRQAVREFAKRHLHGLDQQINAEQRRSEADLALRRLEYGAATEDGAASGEVETRRDSAEDGAKDGEKREEEDADEAVPQKHDAR